ncbi:hypothetical protein B0T20DRAFT_451564 [Sordaria brevicollis]|uniref:Uncharacterized protein n=1 Tax=Sordaria brevicollis TaxID=83679 RepID=A0AAE0PJD3_SORBR|nr:hypothetical protein B0T20DRAFT_451564 [Sordaria brevicollis]
MLGPSQSRAANNSDQKGLRSPALNGIRHCPTTTLPVSRLQGKNSRQGSTPGPKPRPGNGSPLRAPDPTAAGRCSCKSSRPGKGDGDTVTMCNWEQTKFEACGHFETKRMAYSCAIYTRHTYGECRFDPKKSKVFTVISYGNCKECAEMFNKYVNLEA